MATSTPEIPVIKSRLELTYQGQTIELDENHPTVTLGRQQHNDVIVNDSRASRSHARIEYYRGKFTLVDQSSNGTMVWFQGEKSVLLKREGTQLLGNGVISLGREATPEPETALHFAVKS